MNIEQKIDQLNEIISKEQWQEEYKDIFYRTFDTEVYREIVPQLKDLFKGLNKGKLAKTVVYDFKSKKPIKLND